MCLNITKRFFHRSARMFQQSIQHYSAEELNLHERALHTVRPVSNAGESETATKEIIADVLRGFLLLENAALTGSEQVFVFGVAGKSNAYRHIANALRERERMFLHVTTRAVLSVLCPMCGCFSGISQRVPTLPSTMRLFSVTLCLTRATCLRGD